MSEATEDWLFHSPAISATSAITYQSGKTKMLSLQTVLSILKTIVESRRRVVMLLQASIVNALVFGTLAVAVMSYREGGVHEAYRAYLQPRADATAVDAQIRLAISQAQIRAEATAQQRIKAELRGFLARNRGAARVRLANIHNGTVGIGGKHEWKFDIVAAEAAGGRDPGPLVQNELIAGWPFLKEVIEGRCVTYGVDSLPNTSGRRRLEDMGVRRVATCPVRTPGGDTLGVVFTMYDRDDDLPTGAAFTEMQADSLRVGNTLSGEMIDHIVR